MTPAIQLRYPHEPHSHRRRRPGEVWGNDTYPSSRTVDNRVAGLRAKLERDAAQPEHIRTVHGVGYKFVP
ncbi:MAG TPA: helix-turn-helix domain-containing protein [Bryobacteraceae bacterium]